MSTEPAVLVTETAFGAAQPARLKGKSLVLFLTLLAALGMLATNMYLASFPSIGRDLLASPSQVRLTLTVFLVSFAFGQLLIGPLSDRYGRRPLLIAGLAIYAVAGVLCALAVNLESLLAFRVAQAIGACTGQVLARAVARDIFKGDELTRSISFITTFVAAAPGFSPLIGGLVETFFGWRATFVLLGAVGILALIVVWVRIEETNRNRSASLSLGQAFASYFSLLRHANFVVPITATTFAMFGLFAFFAAAPSIFIGEFGVSPALFGLIPCFTVFAVFAGGLSAPRLSKRWPGSRPILAGLVFMLTGGGGMLVFALAGTGMAQVLGTLVIFLFGMGIVNPLSTVAALRPFPDRAGSASALIGFFQMAGGALGSVALGLLPFSILVALPIIMSIGAALALLVITIGRNRI